MGLQYNTIQCKCNNVYKAPWDLGYRNCGYVYIKNTPCEKDRFTPANYRVGIIAWQLQ